MTKIDLEDLERQARPIAEWDEERDAPDQECVACKCSMYTPSELDPTALCNGCAQMYAAQTAVTQLALIARIRELEAFVAAVPESALQAYKVHREDFPEMFAETGDTCMAMYMDTARAKLLERGAVLP